MDNCSACEEKKLPTLVVDELKALGHEAYFVSNNEDACELALSLIGKNDSVGIPGTLTVRQIGLRDKLLARGNRVYEHWDPQGMSKEEGKRGENDADWFVTSANAVTEKGQLVSCDGAGNRLAGMVNSRRHRMYIISTNKICANLEEAFTRIREVAGVQNATRFFPDLVNNQEDLLKAADQLCRAFLIVEKCPMMPEDTRSVVILVDSVLGY